MKFRGTIKIRNLTGKSSSTLLLYSQVSFHIEEKVWKCEWKEKNRKEKNKNIIGELYDKTILHSLTIIIIQK